MQYVELNNGIKMPQLGLGVWQAKDGREVEQALAVAFEAGYRLVDTAAIYGNEHGVGRAIQSSGLPREELFLTTKLWNADQGYDRAMKAFEASLERLGQEYVDMYLIHWPMPRAGKFVETWRALTKLYEDKRVRAIGVSNFKPTHLETLLEDATVVPAVNQIELHPKMAQAETRRYCAEHGIQVESYSPLMRGGEVLRDPVVARVAEAHGKTAAQVVLRWHLQHGLVAIPKSVTPERIRENIEIFNFELSADEMRAIDELDANSRVSPDPDGMNFGGGPVARWRY
jgi:diketogulonate reductase-like aldo/keto reductase